VSRITARVVNLAAGATSGDQVRTWCDAQPDTPDCYAVWVRNQHGVHVIEGTLQIGLVTGA
jgi:hypothetical protein